MIRIIAGEYRRRQLVAPPDDAVTRPYTQRVKESLFSLLRGWFEDAVVLDLFAGVGTVGLVAVSRGARNVMMVEKDRRIADLLERNVETLGCGDRATVVRGDALGETVLHRAPAPVDLVFLDPPYAMMEDEASRARILAFAARLAPVMARPSFLVLRSPRADREGDHAIAGFAGPETHRYGRAMFVHLYEPVP